LSGRGARSPFSERLDFRHATATAVRSGAAAYLVRSTWSTTVRTAGPREPRQHMRTTEGKALIDDTNDEGFDEWSVPEGVAVIGMSGALP